MKQLLSKTTKPFLIYVLIVLLISVPAYYVVVEKIWVHELDEHNRIISERTSAEFNNYYISDKDNEAKVAFWNRVQPGIFLLKLPVGKMIQDSIFTTNNKHPYVPSESSDNFRVLITTIHINNEPYYFRVVTSFEETRATILAIAGITFFFFIIIFIGLLILNRRLSKTIWMPFRDTLDKLKSFNLNNQAGIVLNKSEVVEFEELNLSLQKLIEHSVSVYKTQKEFTENASHELQTPLAILKNKLDILLQDKDLTDRQYQIAEEMNKALTRSARINKNLLLLAKIENNQFSNVENIELDELLIQSIETLREHLEQKNISLEVKIANKVKVNGNNSLTEILINNLLLNAIRHTSAGGVISVLLTNTSMYIANSGEKSIDQSLLFKRFARISADNSGSGLGLAIIKEICKFQFWKINYKFENYCHFFSIDF